MKIKLNQIEFDVMPVASDLREAILSDPILMQGVRRDVFQWDHADQKGTILVPVTQTKAVPLPNGIAFFVPRIGAGDRIQKADAPSVKMATRFLEGVGGKSILEVMQALNKIVNLPQKTIPVESFAPLNAVASYIVSMNIDYAVVHLLNAARNLGAYFLVPGQVSFTYAVTGVADQTGLDALIATDPKMARIQPGFVIPPGTQANMMLRRLAMARRLTDLQTVLQGKTPDQLDLMDPRRLLAARLGVEWRVLAPQKKAVA